MNPTLSRYGKSFIAPHSATLSWSCVPLLASNSSTRHRRCKLLVEVRLGFL